MTSRPTTVVPTTVVFCGPSITADEVRVRFAHELGAEPGDALITLPPVAQGDVIAAVLQLRPHTIVIIDGVFERVPAVWHKEILWAMEGGVRVFGSSSMGALRAAELHPFGMTGVGAVFSQFRDGVLVDDDEVAVAHATADHDHRALSTAMVDLRHLLASVAVARGVLDPDQARLLVAQAKALPYPDRALPNVLRAAAEPSSPHHLTLPPSVADELRALGRSREHSRKHLDAVECIAVVAAHLAGSPPGSPPQPPPDRQPWSVEPTMFLVNAIREVEERLGATEPTPADVLELVGTSEAVLRKQVVLRLAARELAAQRGIELDDAAVPGALANFRRRYGLEDDEALDSWLRAHGLAREQVIAALTDIALVDHVEHHLREEVDAALPDLVRFQAARRATPDAHAGTA